MTAYNIFLKNAKWHKSNLVSPTHQQQTVLSLQKYSLKGFPHTVTIAVCNALSHFAWKTFGDSSTKTRLAICKSILVTIPGRPLGVNSQYLFVVTVNTRGDISGRSQALKKPIVANHL